MFDRSNPYAKTRLLEERMERAYRRYQQARSIPWAVVWLKKFIQLQTRMLDEARHADALLAAQPN